MNATDAEEPRTILTGFCRVWKNQDLAGALDFVHDNVVYAMFIPQEVVPFGGETLGKPAMADRMRMIIAQFETLRFEETIIKVDNDLGYARVAYAFRHKMTGETIEGFMRIVVRVQEGLIIDHKEYHDVEKVRAFMRLVAHVAADRTEIDC